MRVIAFGVRVDEIEHFERAKTEFGVEIDYVEENLTTETVHKTKGYESVLIIACPVTREVVEKLHDWPFFFTFSSLTTYYNQFNAFFIFYVFFVGFNASTGGGKEPSLCGGLFCSITTFSIHWETQEKG